MRFVLALLLVIGLGSNLAVSRDHSHCADLRGARPFTPAADALDLQALLSDPTKGFQPQCCCTLRGVAEDRDLTGAAQSGLSFKPLGDDYEAFLRLSANSFLYVGLAKVKDDDSIVLSGANGRGLMLFKPDDAQGFTWTAWLEGVESGSGTMN